MVGLIEAAQMRMIYWWGWWPSLAGSNVAPKLELARAWEPLDKSRPSQDYERTSSHSVLSHGKSIG